VSVIACAYKKIKHGEMTRGEAVPKEPIIFFISGGVFEVWADCFF
jgi:hypothetical protein